MEINIDVFPNTIKNDVSFQRKKIDCMLESNRTFWYFYFSLKCEAYLIISYQSSYSSYFKELFQK